MGAWKRDRIFEKAGEIVLMGGITEPLLFEKKKMDELNFPATPGCLSRSDGREAGVCHNRK